MDDFMYKVDKIKISNYEINQPFMYQWEGPPLQMNLKYRIAINELYLMEYMFVQFELNNSPCP